MNRQEFDRLYNQAQKTIIHSDPYFMTAGYVWISLTRLQGKKLAALMIQQGAKHDDLFAYLDNGLGIWR